MEISEISMISDHFEAGVNCLQNPSMVSRFFTLSGIEKVPQVYSFWKWGAVILAILATFSSLMRRIKLFFIRFRSVKPSAEPLLQLFSDDFDFSDDEDDDDVVDDEDDDGDDSSSVSSFEDDKPTTSFQGDRDFSVKGGDFYRWQNGNLRLRRKQTGGQRFSWSDFSAGKSVVKLWDSLGLGFDFEDSCKSMVSMWDFNEFAPVAGLAAQSRPVVLSAKVNNDKNDIVLGAYDTRMGNRKPAVYANWGPPAVASEALGIHADGVEKVYVRDDVTGVLTLGDLRKFEAPLETVTKTDGDTWWDADAVMVEEEKI